VDMAWEEEEEEEEVQRAWRASMAR
jgi:hypothetical protein